jgi:hypothetical protein
MARNQDDANVRAADWSDVRLGIEAPMNLGKVGPRSDAVVAPECISQVSAIQTFEPNPAAYSRANAVRADNPTRSDGLSWHCDPGGRNARDRRPPEQSHPCSLGAFHQMLMKHDSPDTYSLPRGKFCFNAHVAIKKAHPA